MREGSGSPCCGSINNVVLNAIEDHGWRSRRAWRRKAAQQRFDVLLDEVAKSTIAEQERGGEGVEGRTCVRCVLLKSEA